MLYHNGKPAEKYDDFGLPIYKEDKNGTVPPEHEDENETVQSEYEYDEAGRLITERHSDGQVITHEYGDKAETVYCKDAYGNEKNVEIFKYFMN